MFLTYIRKDSYTEYIKNLYKSIRKHWQDFGCHVQYHPPFCGSIWLLLVEDLGAYKSEHCSGSDSISVEWIGFLGQKWGDLRARNYLRKQSRLWPLTRTLGQSQKNLRRRISVYIYPMKMNNISYVMGFLNPISLLLGIFESIYVLLIRVQSLQKNITVNKIVNEISFWY